jgi:tRNA uridine 5-carboxymethylaminomethyl modification enzyme
MGDSISTLSDSLAHLGFEIKRFKTGTPCRINSRSIDFSKCEIQPGDTPAPAFSYLSGIIEEDREWQIEDRAGSLESGPSPSSILRPQSSISPLPSSGPAQFTLNSWRPVTFHVEQIPCWITYTNPQTHDIIRANLDKSPMYCGRIEGVGPRYCPSIEDNVVRFAEKERHQQ